MFFIFKYLLVFNLLCITSCFFFPKIYKPKTRLHVSDEKIYIEKNFKNVIRKEIYKNPEYDDLLSILFNLEKTFIDINKLLRCVSINNLEGTSNKINIQNEEQKKLDLISNRIFTNSLCASGKIDKFISEEEDNICSCSSIIDSKSINQKYYAVFDPLDGSSNIDNGLPTGSIFGIYKKNYDGDILQKGSNLVLAGYCLYSASTQLVITLGIENFLFMYDDKYNQFILTKKNIRIPNFGSIYSFNFGNMADWNLPVKKFINESLDSGNKFSSRYIGALVADTHNILFNGGIFGYPSTSKNPNGKLRLLYEAIPIAHIIENFGGMATNGTHRILNIKPDDIHQRTPLFFGSPNLISSLTNCFEII